MLNFTEIVVNFLEKIDFEEKKSPHTLVAYSCDLCQAFSHFLPERVSGPKIDGSERYEIVQKNHQLISEADLQESVSKYLRSLSHLQNSSRARKVATLKKFYQFLVEKKIIEKIHPLLIAPKKLQKIPNFLTIDEAIAVLQTFEKPLLQEDPSRRLRREILFLLLYGCGLRVSEACSLTWQSVNLSKREMRVLGKGQKERVISFPRLLLKKLASLRQTQNQKYVWGEHPLNTRTAYNDIRFCGVSAQLSKSLHPHALRHSFATHLLNDGADLRIIQEMLGHSSLRATEQYTHITLNQLTETLERFHPLNKKVI